MIFIYKANKQSTIHRVDSISRSSSFFLSECTIRRRREKKGVWKTSKSSGSPDVYIDNRFVLFFSWKMNKFHSELLAHIRVCETISVAAGLPVVEGEESQSAL